VADDFKYHIDHHGSLVRPSGLLAARTGDDPVALAAAETEAAAAVSHALRRLALSAARPLMTEDAQVAKLRLVETVARYYWGNEI
jgi:hypothetical protein